MAKPKVNNSKFSTINLRITAEERKELDAKLLDYGLTTATFLRQVFDAFMTNRLSIKKDSSIKSLLED